MTADNAIITDAEKLSRITVHLCCCWQPFSLTKYSAIFTEVKGYFGIFDNELVGSLFGRN
jgi:hypothetical protein